VKKKYKKNYNLVITDNIGDIDGFVLNEEVSLLLPYADKLLAPIIKKELTKKSTRSKVRIGPSAKKG
jgi:hypothetical protein